jgi:hypothetical protein
VDDNHFSIKDRFFDRNVESLCDQWKAVGPVVPVAGKNPDTLVQMYLQPVAVKFDFIKPFASGPAPWLSA